MAPGPCVLALQTQRHARDCGIACLAMLLGLSYEDVLLAAPYQAMHCGMSTRQILLTAKRLGFQLRVVRTFDLEEDTGLLRVGKRKWKTDHLVMLKAGHVFDTDAVIWEVDVFLAAFQAQSISLYMLR